MAGAGEALECQACGSALTIGAHERSARCYYCASPNVVARPTAPGRPDPVFVVGFVVTKERALEIARRWVKKPWLAPQAFRNARVDEIRGLYVPSYLYSAEAYSNYTASIGENYTVTEVQRVNGRTVVRTKTKTEWRQLAGQHGAYIADRVVTASRGIPNHELEAIEPFDLRALHRYTPKVISGWAAEEPSMFIEECKALAHQEALADVGQQLARFMPGDRHSNLQYQTRLDREHLALTLMPVWVLPVRYAPDKPLVRLLVNGQTGRIYGKPPRSNLKVALVVLAVLAPILLCILLFLVAGMIEGRV